MNLLLDTHIFLWWVGNLKRLSPQALHLLKDPNNTLIFSVASVWEMQIKQQLGKLSFHTPLAEMIEEQQRRNGLRIQPVELNHVLELKNLPPVHKDPFDRLLIAQARVEDFHLLSADPVMARYTVNLAV